MSEENENQEEEYEMEALEYEMILRRIEGLKLGTLPNRGALKGIAEADLWRMIGHLDKSQKTEIKKLGRKLERLNMPGELNRVLGDFQEEFTRLKEVISGLLLAIDILGNEIRSLKGV